MKVICVKCGKRKGTKDFPPDKHKRNGLGSWCRECKNWRKNPLTFNINKYRKREIEQKREKRANNPGWKAKEYAEYCRKFPEKVKAQQSLNRAIRTGKIKRSPCEVCGENRKYRVHAHHDDYSKPLEVRFLCSIHHKQAHVKHKPIK